MPTYRAFPVDQAGHIFAEPREFDAKNDLEAIAQATAFADSHAIEVWDQERRIGLIELRPPED
jgi:hypothetical protein